LRIRSKNDLIIHMEIPKFYETFIPVLAVLEKYGTLNYNDLRKKVRDEYYNHLPQNLLEQTTKSGDILILNRVGWAKAYLKQAELVYQPERAMVAITEKGKSVLKIGKLTLEDIRNDQDWIKNTKQRNQDVVESINEGNLSPEDKIESGFNELENSVKNDLLERVRSMDPYDFEIVVLKLLKSMGYGEFVETAKSGDGGIDGIINQDQLGLEKIYIQAKRYAEDHKVREPLIRDFIGAMSGDTKKGVFVTTSSFDDSAIKKAKDAHHIIRLIDGNTLVDLMYKFNIGVQSKAVYEIKKVDEDFF
jgi:restriction system protein